MEFWGFIWLMFVLKIPVVAAMWIVWWAVRSPDPVDDVPVDDGGDSDGGSPHPRRPRPNPPRRGEHGQPAPRAPRRTRVRKRRSPVRAR